MLLDHLSMAPITTKHLPSGLCTGGQNPKAPVRGGFLLPAQALQSCFVCSASARRPLDLHHATPALALFRTRGSRWCVARMGWPNPSNAT